MPRLLLIATAIATAIPPSVAFGCRCDGVESVTLRAVNGTTADACCGACQAAAKPRPCCNQATGRSSGGGPAYPRPADHCDCQGCGCPVHKAPPLATEATPPQEAPLNADAASQSALLAPPLAANARLAVAAWRQSLWRTPPPGVQSALCVWTL